MRLRLETLFGFGFSLAFAHYRFLVVLFADRINEEWISVTVFVLCCVVGVPFFVFPANSYRWRRHAVRWRRKEEQNEFRERELVLL